MNLKQTLYLALAAGCFSLAAAPAVINDPYGAHGLNYDRTRNHDSTQRELQLMREAGVNYVRHWEGIKPWDFSDLDRAVSLAKQENIQFLSTLAYNVAWPVPPWRNRDAWGEYVRRAVSRYAKDVRYWEIWNEENIAVFWKDPNAADYAAFLKLTYEEIKKIDPKLSVGYGGTAKIPLRYIEDSFKAGAGKYFDFMNIHPYHMEGEPEDMILEIRNLKALMTRYGVGDKPIWITEVGWPIPPRQPVFLREVLQAALRRIGIDPAKTAATVVCDAEKSFSGAALFARNGHLAMFQRVDGITLDQLRGLSVERCPVLIPTRGEDFPAKYIPELVDYVKRGGTLILPSGMPFYYDVTDGDFVQINDKFMKDFHIGWETSWTKQGVPKQESYQKPAAGFEDAFQITQADFLPAGRFLHGRNLKPGDEFIPIIEAGTDSYQAAVAGLYKLNSDLKGNIIVCTRWDAATASSESVQAEMLPRTYLVALANGIERIFWYRFCSQEGDPHNFNYYYGIVRQNLEPRPAYRAYQTLTRLCPSDSTVPSLTHQGDTFLSGWTRPDGTKVWAVWDVLQQRKIRLDVQGNVAEALNHLGEKQPVPEGEAVASPAILYLVGPESVTINPL